MPTLKITTKLPTYANDMLWLVGAGAYQHKIHDALDKDLPQGVFSLHWGTPDGSALMQWPAGTENLFWDGTVAVSGFVDVSHLLTKDDLDLMVVEVRGHLRAADAPRLPTRADLQKKPFKRDDFVEETDEAPHWYAFLLPLESPLSDFAHHALVNGYAVDFFGSLADEGAGFEQWLGLPLLLESMTLFG